MERVVEAMAEAAGMAAEVEKGAAGMEKGEEMGFG